MKLVKPCQLIPPVISRPFRFIVLGWMLVGAFSALGPFVGSTTLDGGIHYYELAVGVLMMVGAATLSFSTLDWKQQTTTWKLELIGWPPSAAAWLLFAAVAASPTAFVFSVSFFLASVFRLIEVMLFMRVNRGQWEDMKNGRHA